MRARKITEQIINAAREGLICDKPIYDTIHLGERLIQQSIDIAIAENRRDALDAALMLIQGATMGHPLVVSVLQGVGAQIRELRAVAAAQVRQASDATREEEL